MPDLTIGGVAMGDTTTIRPTSKSTLDGGVVHRPPARENGKKGGAIIGLRHSLVVQGGGRA